MQLIHKSFLEPFPQEFHSRLIRDDNGDYWISCQLRSALRDNDDSYYPFNAYVVIEHYSVSEDGTIIFEDLG